MLDEYLAFQEEIITRRTQFDLKKALDRQPVSYTHLYDRKILDLQRRYDEQYDTIEEIEVQIGELQSQIRSIQQEKICLLYTSRCV